MGAIAPMSVIGVVMISSPGSGSMAATAVWIAAVPEVTARACRVPCSSAKAASKAFTWVPLVQLRVPELMTARRSANSSSPRSRPLGSVSDGKARPCGALEFCEISWGAVAILPVLLSFESWGGPGTGDAGVDRAHLCVAAQIARHGGDRVAGEGDAGV